ncbi:hypothetical protein BO94DRAFT_541769 [Aspergillus sclerotioniger CBS 115572]|uniref:Uncharacterized protein n=1 Tax=Aspergillus sclerotioniger CBS 115572 TaxID=1450535 RepID=A0A317XF48_9EURO|nr:hypothetical protein BO94DRAFT_541769 [Aspergillus sclerotioniger CBS 115572]PWY95648.1 hypothetical protein BO94DRAFT_541769 [Aspergillus sclerotioniger CBS 115572]
MADDGAKSACKRLTRPLDVSVALAEKAGGQGSESERREREGEKYRTSEARKGKLDRRRRGVEYCRLVVSLLRPKRSQTDGPVSRAVSLVALFNSDSIPLLLDPDLIASLRYLLIPGRSAWIRDCSSTIHGVLRTTSDFVCCLPGSLQPVLFEFRWTT